MAQFLLVIASMLFALGGVGAGDTPSGDARTSISLQVEPQSEFCFYEVLPAAASAEALVMVYRGGKLDVGLRIEGPLPASSSPTTPGAGPVLYERLLYSNLDDRTGQPLPTIVKKGYSFSAPAEGTYAFCINNKMAKVRLACALLYF